MNVNQPADDRISAWLLAEAPTDLPDGLLQATLGRTREARQKRSILDWWTPRMGRTRSPALALGALASLLVGIAGVYLVSGPLFTATPSPTAEPSVSQPNPFVRGSHWLIESLNGDPMPPNAADQGYVLVFNDSVDRVLYDSGCNEQGLTVSIQPGTGIDFHDTGSRTWCGGTDYVALNSRIVGALESTERWQPAGTGFDLIGTNVIHVRQLVGCTATESYGAARGSRTLECPWGAPLSS